LPGLREVLASAAVPNLFVKVSGFHYASERGWDHPWPDAVALLRRIFDAYGPRRLCWGSDFPASRRFCTYRQSLEVVRTHCRFLTPGDLRLVLGETLREILSGRLPAG
jgi:predicted TIM-barrel fold metal-dependent hydrolase